MLLCFVSYGSYAQVITARITPFISTNNDSLYLDFEIIKSVYNDPLGNSDFVFRITESNTSVPGLNSPIDLNGFTIKKRGKWDASNPSDTNYLPMELVKSVDNTSYILKVRTKAPVSGIAPAATSIIPNTFGSNSLVARLATKIENFACVDSIKLEWNRLITDANPLGYLTFFRFVIGQPSNTFLPVSTDNYIRLNPKVVAPPVGAASLPQAVLFTWYKPANARRYVTEVTLRNKTVFRRRIISNTDTTELRVQTIPRDTVYLRLGVLSSCPYDTVWSDIAYNSATECPVLPLTAANVSFDKTTPYCPVDPITLTLDTTGMNLTKPVRFSFNNGVTYGLANSTTFKGRRDTTLKVTFQDGNFCFANAIISARAQILQLVNPNSGITMNLVDSVCTGSPIILQYLRKAGSDANLDYTWTTNGLGNFVDANGNKITDPNLNPVTYIPASGEVGKVTFTATNACFAISAKDSIKLIAVPVASIEIDPTQIANGVVQTVTPIRFTRTNAQPGERYSYTFSNGASITDTSASTITKVFTEGGNYTVTLSVKNASGCIDTALLRFKVQETFSVFVPNIFSPRANSPADQNFRINGTGVSDGLEMLVYDKWGKEVYTNTSFSSARDFGWNGKKSNVGDEQQSGTYTYVIRGKYVNGKSFEKTGSVTLIR